MNNYFFTTGILTILFVLCLCGCQSCGSEIGEKVWNQTDRIEYFFYDSSLPPEYHRSYSLVVTPKSARISITSYSTKLFDESYNVNPEQFKKVVSGLRGLGIKKKRSRDVNPCSGGTAESLRLYLGKESLFEGYQDNCEYRRSTMVVEKRSIPEVLDEVYPKPINEIVDDTRKRNDIE